MPITENDILALKQRLDDNKHIPFATMDRGFRNFTGSVFLPDAVILRIETVSALQDILTTLHNLNFQKKPSESIIVRPAAGGHFSEKSQSYSMTPCCEADVILHLTGKEFCSLEKVDGNIARIGASLTIGEADRLLYEKFDLSLPSSSLIPDVTVIGLAANAGHGTGRSLSSFSGLIRRMTLILEDGTRVELDSNHPDFETIRGAHLGLFGIVTDMDIECIPACKMICVRKKCTVPELYTEISRGLINAAPYTSILIVPNIDECEQHGKNDVVIYQWSPIEKTFKDTNWHPGLDEFLQHLQVEASELLKINELQKRFPKMIPFISRLIAHEVVGKNGEIACMPMWGMHYQHDFPNQLEDMDFLFRTDSQGSNLQGIIQYIVDTLQSFEDRESSLYPLTQGIYLRFFRGTRGGLSTSPPADNTLVCGLDMVTGKDIPGYPEFREKMEDYFIRVLNAKPHWGKTLPKGMNTEKLYGKDFHAFIGAYERWYASHHLYTQSSMLLNNFHRQILGPNYRLMPELAGKKTGALFEEKPKPVPSQKDISQPETQPVSVERPDRAHVPCPCGIL